MSTSDLPIDFSHPAVREYIALTRLQVLTPLSLLINIAAVVICGTVITPTIGDISSSYHPTTLTPRMAMVALLMSFVYCVQIGYCVLLVFARKVETKKTLIQGVGLSLVLANWLMAFWAIAFVSQLWILSTVLLGVLTLILAYANIVLLIYHAPVGTRPLDTLFIHVPVRLFLLLPLNLLFWQSLFITLDWSWHQGEPEKYTCWAWEGFIVVLLGNLLALLVVFLRQDIVWCVGSAWIDVSILAQKPKPIQVTATATTFTIVLPLALALSYLWFYFRSGRRQGAIALPSDDVIVIPEDDNDRNHIRAPPPNDAERTVWG